MINRVLKINFEYRVEISYLIFIMALFTLMLNEPLVYERLAASLAINTPNSMTLLFLIIAILNIMAGLLRVSACAHLGSDIMMKKEVQAKKMVIAGPYSYVRNPIYLSDTIAMSATALAGNYYTFAALFIGKIISSFLFCIYEEETLLKYMGTEYRDYYDRVPRFIPKFYPYYKTAIISYKNYKDGLKNSFYPFGIAAGFFAGAITQNFMYVFLIGMIAPIAWFALYRKKR